MQNVVHGARPAYVVVKLDGTVKRRKVILTARKIGEGKTAKTIHEREERIVEEPAGYLVYFPRGHAIRCKDKKELRRRGLAGIPPIVDISGLQDPKSPLGKLIVAQDDAQRKEAQDDLQMKVIRIVTHRAGTGLVLKEEGKHWLENNDDIDDERMQVANVDAVAA